MRRVSVEELLEGAARLTIDGSGAAVAPLTLVDLDGTDWSAADRLVHELTAHRTGAVVGVAARGLAPESEPVLDALTFTLAPDGPGRAWVAPPEAIDRAVDRVVATVAHAPVAALTLVDLLGLTSRLDVRDGLVAESLAYSTLLAGPEFGAWRAATPRHPVPDDDEPVLVARDGATLLVRLNRPARHNAFDRAVRDAFLEALTLAELDDSITSVAWSGEGRSFCSGGDLDEFGTAADVATAHVVRLARSAGWAVHGLRDRVRPVLHGACIGAGIEVPAFADHVVARPDATFSLPEVGFGLLPGAGGTVSVTRRIGRWRTAYLALSGQRVGVDRALDWGLVDGRA